MAMTPEERNKMEQLERKVDAMMSVRDTSFIAELERRLNFVSGTLSLNDLSDVVITSPTNGQVLKFNGTNWVEDTDNTV